MTPASARRRGAVLFYASCQFVVLTAAAMASYPGGTLLDWRTSGYQFFGNFLSDLGATRAWSGRPNGVAAVLFAIALATLGTAFIFFARTWRAFAFAHRRARVAGLAGELFGIASGAAFLAVAATPVDRAISTHNAFVIAAFGLLLGYAASLTIVWSRNGASAAQRAACIGYLVLVAAYVVSVGVAVRMGVTSPRGVWLMVASQKVIAYASMAYVAYLTLAIRRQLGELP